MTDGLSDDPTRLSHIGKSGEERPLEHRRGVREIWRLVVNCPGYEVSSLGRVRWTRTPQIKAPTIAADGKLVVNLYRRGRSNVRAVHSVVAEAFLGPRAKSQMVAHKDGDRENCAAANLAYVSLSARRPGNGRDQNRYLVGKLTSDLAQSIRNRALAGERVIDLAKEYGVSCSLISNIKAGKKWRSLPRAKMVAESSPSAKSHYPEVSLLQARLTILDPDPSRAELIAHQFAPFAYTVRVAHSLAELAAQWPPAGFLVVFDRDGLVESTQRLMTERAQWRAHIGLSDVATPEEVGNAVFGGAIDYLGWPISEVQLSKRIGLWRSRARSIGVTVARRRRAGRLLAALSPRELEILTLVSSGRTDAEIAVLLNLSQKTCQVHRANIFRKLNTNKSIGAVRLLLEAAFPSYPDST